MRKNNLFTFLAIASILSVAIIAGCTKDEPVTVNSAPLKGGLKSQSSNAVLLTVPLGGVSSFTVLGATTVTNDGASLFTGNLGVSPGTAITGFQPFPLNIIMGPGTVTAGLGIVKGTIYAGGPVALQAHNDAVIAYNYLAALVPDTTYAGVSQLDGLTFTPGVYKFAPSANLQVNGKVYLDFQGNSNAMFVFQMGTTLVTMNGSKVIALNNNGQTCIGSNVYWAIGSSATIDGAQFIGSVIATTTITMTSGANVSGRMLALNGAVTMITDTISVCSGDSVPPVICKDFVTGGGSIKGHYSGRATFGISGGIKNNKFWGQLSYNDGNCRKGLNVKSTKVTAYILIDAVTRQIEGIAKINGKGAFTYKVIVVDNGKSGSNDKFSLELSNGYKASGVLKCGNISIHIECGGPCDKNDKEKYNDKDETDGNNNCYNDYSKK